MTSTEVVVRNSLKVLMAALALAGITGMYLSQVRRNGVLGLVGYVVFAAGYLTLMIPPYVAAFVLPPIADAETGYVDDVLAAATGRGPTGDIGPLATVFAVQGFAYLAGGLLFGIALYRAGVLTRWAAVLLAVSGPISATLPLLPDALYRLLAFPNGVAMVALGYSLWRQQRQVVPAAAGGTEARPRSAAVR